MPVREVELTLEQIEQVNRLGGNARIRFGRQTSNASPAPLQSPFPASRLRLLIDFPHNPARNARTATVIDIREQEVPAISANDALNTLTLRYSDTTDEVGAAIDPNTFWRIDNSHRLVVPDATDIHISNSPFEIQEIRYTGEPPQFMSINQSTRPVSELHYHPQYPAGSLWRMSSRLGSHLNSNDLVEVIEVSHNLVVIDKPDGSLPDFESIGLEDAGLWLSPYIQIGPQELRGDLIMLQDLGRIHRGALVNYMVSDDPNYIGVCSQHSGRVELVPIENIEAYVDFNSRWRNRIRRKYTRGSTWLLQSLSEVDNRGNSLDDLNAEDLNTLVEVRSVTDDGTSISLRGSVTGNTFEIYGYNADEILASPNRERSMFEVGSKWILCGSHMQDAAGNNPIGLDPISTDQFNQPVVVTENASNALRVRDPAGVIWTMYTDTAWRNLREFYNYDVGGEYKITGTRTQPHGRDPFEVSPGCLGRVATIIEMNPDNTILRLNGMGGRFAFHTSELHKVLAPRIETYEVGSRYLVRSLPSRRVDGQDVGVGDTTLGEEVVIESTNEHTVTVISTRTGSWSFGTGNLHECLIRVGRPRAAVPFSAAEIEATFHIGSRWKLHKRIGSRDTSLPQSWLGKEIEIVDHKIVREERGGDEYRNLVVRLVGTGEVLPIYYRDARMMLKSTSEIEQMAKKSRDRMRDLAETTTLRKAMDLIKCGLEFEFHSLNGLEAGQQGRVDPSSPPNLELLGRDVADRMRQTDKSLLAVAKWGFKSAAMNRRLSELAQQGATEINELSVPDEKLRSELVEHFNACLDKMKAKLSDEFLNGNRERYLARAPKYSDIMGPAWAELVNTGIAELGSDGSVRGGEIRTRGGRKITEFLKVAKVLASNKFLVDDGCSFHIHLSVPGINHSYGRRFQAEMYAYLLKHFETMPKGMRTRMVSDKGAKRWAKMELVNGDKYVAIFKHESGTWEFRLFGNVHEFSDMYKCLSLAVGALRHAYRVKLKLVPSLLRGASLNTIAAALAKAKTQPEKFFTLLAAEMGAEEEIELSAA